MAKYTLKAETGKFESKLQSDKPTKEQVINDLVEALVKSRDMLIRIQWNVDDCGYCQVTINNEGLDAIIDQGEQALDMELKSR